jgi:hypothetical protein
LPTEASRVGWAHPRVATAGKIVANPHRIGVRPGRLAKAAEKAPPWKNSRLVRCDGAAQPCSCCQAPSGIESEESIDTNTQLTHGDIEVGVKLVDALVRHARTRGGEPVSYADLLTLARYLHPRDVAVDRAVPLGIGMKLAFVQQFCRAGGLPNLACLAVHTGSMRPPADYAGDWEAERRAVANHDWSGVDAPLAAFAADARARVPRRFKPRKERPADVAWYAWFCSHRDVCKEVGGEEKKEVINLLMSGLDPEAALRRVLAAKAQFAAAG